MSKPDIRPANQFCRNYGVKAILYGQAGTNKTPSVATAPRPLLMIIEPGVRSLKNSNIPAAICDTPAKIDEFFQWWFGSNDNKQYDTLAVDSGSHWAEILLAQELKSTRHGQKAYGEMADKFCNHSDKLFHMPQKNVVIICKEAMIKRGSKASMVNGQVVVEDVMQASPYFPGNVLGIKLPHQYDCIWQAQWFHKDGQRHSAVRTMETESVYARTRGGLEANMQEIEPLDYTYLFKKLSA